ncbi:hypothetical protein X474_21615 [Dethiosulfatarculus sandiegensis]|uniref:Uncharacterized protein n=1 Tax=Dethiosulfatarculus sandiegensis TaxID=1429043 RepID=A0A0D2J8A9_9BACT|nr:hypothetical protein X474_21615 [Dethiosulfatarculus sandiegensis]
MYIRHVRIWVKQKDKDLIKTPKYLVYNCLPVFRALGKAKNLSCFWGRVFLISEERFQAKKKNSKMLLSDWD